VLTLGLCIGAGSIGIARIMSSEYDELHATKASTHCPSSSIPCEIFHVADETRPIRLTVALSSLPRLIRALLRLRTRRSQAVGELSRGRGGGDVVANARPDQCTNLGGEKNNMRGSRQRTCRPARSEWLICFLGPSALVLPPELLPPDDFPLPPGIVDVGLTAV
jgi:hypothetical protein